MLSVSTLYKIELIFFSLNKAKNQSFLLLVICCHYYMEQREKEDNCSTNKYLCQRSVEQSFTITRDQWRQKCKIKAQKIFVSF